MSYSTIQNYVEIDPVTQQLNDATLVQMSNLAKNLKTKNMDSLKNVMRDSYVGNFFGINQINVAKHGFDLKTPKASFVECKNSDKQSSWTWNDLPLEKCSEFKNDNFYFIGSVWENLCNLQYVIVAKKMHEMLERKWYHAYDRMMDPSTKTNRITFQTSRREFEKNSEFVILNFEELQKIKSDALELEDIL